MKHCFTNDERASCAKRALERGVVSPLDRPERNQAREPQAAYRVAA